MHTHADTRTQTPLPHTVIGWNGKRRALVATCALHSLPLLGLLILAGEEYIAPVFPILTLLLQNRKEYPNVLSFGGQKCNGVSSWFSLFPPYIKDNKVTRFLIWNPTCFPGSLLQPTQTQTFTSKTEAVGKIFLAAEMGSCHQDMAGFLLYCLPALAPVLQRELYVISLADMWRPVICLPFGSAAAHKSITLPGKFKLVLQPP